MVEGDQMTRETHFPSINELSDYHRKKIDELRNRAIHDLAVYPEYDTDFSLLRWLLGYDYDIETILPKLHEAIITLTTLNLDEENPSSETEANDFVKNLNSAAPYFPGGIMGQDDEGNVIFMQAIARAHPKSLIRACSVSDFFRTSVSQTEMCFKLIRKAEAKSGKKLGLKIIMDLDGFGMDLLYRPTLKIYKTLLTIAQDTFPDFARKIYVINTPIMIKAIYNMISPVLSKQTKEKINFLGSDWKDVLVTDLGAHNIYPYWGGVKPHLCPTGDLRMGGVVPLEFLYSPENDIQDVIVVKMAAKSKEEVIFQGEKGKTIHWWWRVSSGDLDFWIEKDSHYQWPKFKLSTEFFPEIGKIVCLNSGQHVFHFESNGSVWSKELRYKIWME